MLFRPETPSIGIATPKTQKVATVILEPRAECMSAISRIQSVVPNTEADFHKDGFPRIITSSHRRGLLPSAVLKKHGKKVDNVRAHARKLVSQPDVIAAFGLQGVHLRVDGVVKETDGNYRVDFKQVLCFNDAGKKSEHRVRNGFVQVYMSKCGRIDQVTSTVRHGVQPASLSSIITPAAALAAAQKMHGAKDGKNNVAFSFSLHEGKFNPVYDVVINSDTPKKKIYAYIVDANTGEVVYSENKLHFLKRRRNNAVGTVACSTLLNVPNPDQPISDQVHDQILKWVDPKNPTILGNDRYRIVIGADDRQVKANADGSFKFAPNTSEFRAVANFFAVMFETELFESVGAKVAEQYTLSVDNPEVVDNAYCDYMSRMLKIGVGSGNESGGLATDLSNDIGVVQHECGHKFAGDEVPGGELGGSQGAAINEGACGDGSYLVSNFLMRALYGKELGHTLTKEDIANDELVIGSYAVPKVGIRTQKNDTQEGKDEQGEEHADGLIPGAATAELLQGLATAPDVKIEDGLRLYAKLYIKALNRLPKASTITFSDLLRAFITADEQVTKGANRKLIEKCFNRHNIKTSTKRSK